MQRMKNNRAKVLLALIMVALIGFAAWYMWQNQTTDNTQPKNDSAQQDKTTIDPQAQAIEQAKQYRPEGVCAMVLTPAVHTATGAKYTFPSGCLPAGWESE